MLVLLFLYSLPVLPLVLFYCFYALFRKLMYGMKINNLLENIESREDLLYMDFKDFLNMTAEVYRRKGYKLKFPYTSGEGTNCFILDDILFVEVWKHSLNHMVDIEAAMKLNERMQYSYLYRGILITLGDFKQNTGKFCCENSIEYINGEQLVAMCREVRKKAFVY